MGTTLPPEIWCNIATTVMLEYGVSHLLHFMMSFKVANLIGVPVLYRSIRLGWIRNFEDFERVVNQILKGRAHFVFEIEVPRSFQSEMGEADTGLGRSLLVRLVNLKQLSIVSTPSCSNELHQTLGYDSYWRPTMFENVTFRLERIIATFSNMPSFQSFLNLQPGVRSWMVVDRPGPMAEWQPQSLDSLCFLAVFTHKRDILSTLPPRGAAFRSGIIKMTIRGMVGQPIYNFLLTFTNLRSLSVNVCRNSGLSNGDALARIIATVPTLQHLVFWTVPAGGGRPSPKIFGQTRPRHQELMGRLFNILEIPKMPNLESLIIVVPATHTTKVSLEHAQLVMDRCQDLQSLDIIQNCDISRGSAFRRSSGNKAYAYQDILYSPCKQDFWF